MPQIEQERCSPARGNGRGQFIGEFARLLEKEKGEPPGGLVAHPGEAGKSFINLSTGSEMDKTGLLAQPGYSKAGPKPAEPRLGQFLLFREASLMAAREGPPASPFLQGRLLPFDGDADDPPWPVAATLTMPAPPRPRPFPGQPLHLAALRLELLRLLEHLFHVHRLKSSFRRKQSAIV